MTANVHNLKFAQGALLCFNTLRVFSDARNIFIKIVNLRNFKSMALSHDFPYKSVCQPVRLVDFKLTNTLSALNIDVIPKCWSN